MDISALKNNVNVASPSPSPSNAVAKIANFQVASPSITGEFTIISEVHSSDKKLEKKLVKIEDVQQMTTAMNHFLQVSNADMQVTLHDETNQLMVRFVDTKSGQVLKEFPSHEFLDTIAHIRDYVGILLDKKI